MSNSFQVIEVWVWIDPCARRFSFWEGYCPHLVVRDSIDYGGVRVIGIETKHNSNAVVPGEVARVTFQLLYFDERFEENVALYRGFKARVEFEICEGSKTVGFGCVAERYLNHQK